MEQLRNFLDYKYIALLLAPLAVILTTYLFGDLLFEKLHIKVNKKDYNYLIAEYKELFKTDIPTYTKSFSIDVFDKLNIEDKPKVLKVRNVERPRRQEEERPPVYVISLIYIRDKTKYVIINGMIYKEGDSISPDEYIVKITENSVLLNGKWGMRWINL